MNFTTKANALNYDSWMFKKATDKPLIIINESMQFSAGVNLNYVMDFAEKKILNQLKNLLNIFKKLANI